jgi:hypothetical protein
MQPPQLLPFMSFCCSWGIRLSPPTGPALQTNPTNDHSKQRTSRRGWWGKRPLPHTTPTTAQTARTPSDRRVTDTACIGSLLGATVLLLVAPLQQRRVGTKGTVRTHFAAPCKRQASGEADGDVLQACLLWHTANPATPTAQANTKPTNTSQQKDPCHEGIVTAHTDTTDTPPYTPRAPTLLNTYIRPSLITSQAQQSANPQRGGCSASTQLQHPLRPLGGQHPVVSALSKPHSRSG